MRVTILTFCALVAEPVGCGGGVASFPEGGPPRQNLSTPDSYRHVTAHDNSSFVDGARSRPLQRTRLWLQVGRAVGALAEPSC